MPTVSIVLPTYNGSRYIRESIGSVLEQTYIDWELIIVDDCSTDDTLKIVRSYESRDSRIRVIHNVVNKKLPGALNVGFENAKGKYLTWTSDDNAYLPKALTVMVERLEASNVPMVCADICVMDENGIVKKDMVRTYVDEELCRRNTVRACFLYRRQVLDAVGYYDTSLYCVEDYDYWLRVKQKYGRIERIDQVLYKYRCHEASLTSTKKEKILAALMRLRRKHIDFIIEDLRDKKGILCAFYYDLIETHTMEDDIREKILEVYPALRNDGLGAKKKYIVFGAGRFGTKALNILGDKVAFFADNNLSKVGLYKEGKEIISFEKMISLKDKYDIMPTVCNESLHELIDQLSGQGIDQYCTIQRYLAEYFPALKHEKPDE